MTDEDLTLRTILDYARCIVQRDENTLRPLLTLKPKSLTQKEEKALNQPACLRNADLKIPYQILWGAIFRSFYLKDQHSQPTIEFGEPVNYYEFIDKNRPSQMTKAAMLNFASCVIRADPTNAGTLVTGYPGQAAHEAALQALIPQLGPCMHEGVNVSFSKSMLVAYLSEALYWEAKAAS